MRSPISDFRLQKDADNFADNINDGRTKLFNSSYYYVNYYLHRNPLKVFNQEDMNILTPKHRSNYAAAVPSLTRCYTGMECSSDKRYGLSNKYF